MTGARRVRRAILSGGQPGRVEFAFGDDDGRAGEPGVTRRQGDRELAAGHRDRPRRRRRCRWPPPRRPRPRRRRCRTTGSRPSRARALAWPRCAGRSPGPVRRCRPRGTAPDPVPAPGTGRTRQAAHRPGRPGAGSPPRPAAPRYDRPPSTASPGPSTATAPMSTVTPHRRRPVRRTRRGPDRVATVNSGPSARPCADQVPGEHPDPVAAHLGDAAVGVAVVHEPLRPGRAARGPGRSIAAPVRADCPGCAADCAGRARRPVSGAPYRPQHPVRADARPAGRTAGPRDAAVSPAGAVRVEQDHEVVLGAVPLREPHEPIVASARSSRSPASAAAAR